MILHQYKIVFGGTMGAGKSSAIKALSEIAVLTTEALNTDINAHQKLQTTVGIDYGEITLDDGLKIGLYGTPGQDRFDFMWSVICKGAIGTIILIDHADDQPLKALEYYLESFKPYTDNIVIGVTHFDRKPDRSLSIYRTWLKEHHLRFPLFQIDARKKQDILLLVEALVSFVEVSLDQ